MRTYLGGVGTFSPGTGRIEPLVIPGVSDLPVVGALLDRLNWLVYLGFGLVILLAVYFRTRNGRHLLAVGEAPRAAASAGIQVGRMQLWALIVAGCVAGIGGAFLSVGDLGLFTRNMSSDRGWIGITAALLALNRPALLIPAAGIFGFASAASIRLQQLDVPANLTQFIPQGAAFVALVLVGIRSTSRGSLTRLWGQSSRIPIGWLLRSKPDSPAPPAPLAMSASPAPSASPTPSASPAPSAPSAPPSPPAPPTSPH